MDAPMCKLCKERHWGPCLAFSDRPRARTIVPEVDPDEKPASRFAKGRKGSKPKA